jgi:hypothetical protein
VANVAVFSLIPTWFFVGKLRLRVLEEDLAEREALLSGLDTLVDAMGSSRRASREWPSAPPQPRRGPLSDCRPLFGMPGRFTQPVHGRPRVAAGLAIGERLGQPAQPIGPAAQRPGVRIGVRIMNSMVAIYGGSARTAL